MELHQCRHERPERSLVAFPLTAASQRHYLSSSTLLLGPASSYDLYSFQR